jgi:hypothetical protein
MTPRQLCNNLLHKLSVGPRLGKRSHIFEISRGETGHLRKRSTEVCRQPVDNLAPPSFSFLPGQNILSDVPVEKNKVAVDRKRGAEARISNALLQITYEDGIASWYCCLACASSRCSFTVFRTHASLRANTTRRQAAIEASSSRCADASSISDTSMPAISSNALPAMP